MTELKLPLVSGVILGDTEHYGYLGDNGNFVEAGRAPGYPVSLQQLHGDLAIPANASAEILSQEGSPIADLYIGVVDGKVACTRIEARKGKALTSDDLRRIPIAHLVRTAAEAHVVHIRDGFAVRFAKGNPSLAPREEVSSYRRRTLNAEFLEEVARIYRTALATGQAPGIAVEDALGPTTPENARRWISRARKEGYLGASLGQGRKGELSLRSRLAEH